MTDWEVVPVPGLLPRFFVVTQTIHHLPVERVFITDVAGPDMLYLIEFFRVQCTVSPLLGMVFMPKIFRVLRGRGDMFDTSGRIASIKGSAMNMKNITTAVSSDGTVNLNQENDDLKDEVRKLYGQLEQMKMANMEAGNRHLSKSTSLLFNSNMSLASLGNTPNGMKSYGSRREKTTQRLSPAAELASDYV